MNQASATQEGGIDLTIVVLSLYRVGQEISATFADTISTHSLPVKVHTFDEPWSLDIRFFPSPQKCLIAHYPLNQLSGLSASFDDWFVIETSGGWMADNYWREVSRRHFFISSLEDRSREVSEWLCDWHSNNFSPESFSYCTRKLANSEQT